MTWTPERHQVAKQRCERAVEGPWEIYLHEYQTLFPHKDMYVIPKGDYDEFSRGDVQFFIGNQGEWDRDDAEFIATARTDLPDALAEIERLQALLAQAQQFVPTLRELAEETHDVSTYPDPQERTHNIMMIHFAQMWLDEMRSEQESHS